jgi:5'-nucleotidase (lipoprotein e(P4) family)
MKSNRTFWAGLVAGIALATAVGFVAQQAYTPPQHNGTYLELSTNYIQNAAEYRALCYQAYNTASQRLENKLASIRRTPDAKPWAVVVDIDETVLDNSPYQGRQALQGGQFPEGWTDWCNRAQAQAVPGALDFLKLVDSKGIAVFYITNRRTAEREGTLRNLRGLGFPQVQEDRFFFRTDESDKTRRREKVSATHDILMLCGDNLGDFNGVFDKQSIASRYQSTDSLRRYFGETWIVLPNPMYGDWLGAMINHNYAQPWQVLDSLRRSHLRGY